MEISVFSDMKYIEPIKKISNKNYMPYKQIGFFEDKLLSKNISSLKNNLEKRENFIKTYHSPESVKTKNFLIKISNGNNDKTEKDEIKEEDVKQEKDFLPNISHEVKADANSLRKTNSHFNPNNKNENSDENKSKDKINYKKGITKNNLIENDKKYKPNATGFTNTSRFNFSTDEKKDTKNIQTISTKHKNINILTISTKHKNVNIQHNIKSTDKNIFNNQNNLDKSITTNNSILKNQIISGHLNKEIQNLENKGSEVSSIPNTLYSGGFLQAKAEREPDAKSFMTYKKDNLSVTQYNKNLSVDCGNDSFRAANYNNKSKHGSTLWKETKIDSKIDFVYKKIFDKKSRLLIEKPNLDINTNDTTTHRKKPKSKLEKISTELIFSKGTKKRKYIEDKIEDIKRKIFFIKGVYDFSYPKIIVNKVKTSQDFYNTHHSEQKMKLRESMNNTSQKFLEKFEEKCKMTNEHFRKSFQVDKFQKSERYEHEQFETSNVSPDQEIENKMIKTTTSLDLKTLKNSRLTLTQKFYNPSEITPLKVLNPISIKTFYPDLGEPSKLKVIHKSKIL